MSSTTPVGSLMDRLPAPSGYDHPMTRDQAKAAGLKVYPAWVHCRRSSKHGNIRVTSSNRCAACVQLEANLTRDLRARLKDRLKEDAERQVLKRMAERIAEAERQARDIIRAAEKEAANKVRMQERAKAAREARKARAAECALVMPSAIGQGDEGSCPWD